ncbi:MAG: NHL repeat-containing protein [Acidobacteriota bacterium]|nr:NHL repeat-containing protein [Acidobacteriota bacterium]
MTPLRTLPLALAPLALIAGLAGCGSGGSLASSIPPQMSNCKSTVARAAGPAPTANFAGAGFTVKAMAGGVPFRGASVTLYAAGNGGNGSTATVLFASSTPTDATGTMTVPAGYACPFNLSTLYVVTRGYQAGPTTPNNAGIVLMTPLGTCNSLSGGPTFVVDEATTVASAYALAQFLSPGGNVGASATNFSGLSLAAATVANLVNVSTGTVPGASFPATGTAPATVLNSLANGIYACVVSPVGCAQLYAATSVSGSVPSNTLDAMLNVARHPANNVAALYAASRGAAVFAPAATVAPSDWTMFATYAGGGMDAPSGLGIDSAGNVRVASYFSAASFFTNTGQPMISGGVTGNNLKESYGLAIDQSDNSWIPNEQGPFAVNGGLGSVTVLNGQGQSVAGSAGFTQGGLNFPVAIAIDTSGTSWVVDFGNSHLTLLSNSGAPLSGVSGYTTNQFAFPVAIAVDSKCNGFVANQSSDTITKVSPDGASFASFVTGNSPSGVAVDGSDNVWSANYFDNSVGLLSSTGKVVSSGYTGGGLDHPQGIAIDGAGNAWVANYRGPSISELAGASASVPGALLSPAGGFGADARLLEGFGIAIDASGNVWVTNFGSNTLTEFVGMGVPVRTPLLGPVVVP